MSYDFECKCWKPLALHYFGSLVPVAATVFRRAGLRVPDCPNNAQVEHQQALGTHTHTHRFIIVMAAHKPVLCLP